MSEVIAEDHRLLLLLNGLGSEGYDQFWTLVSDRWIWIPLYLVILFLIYRNYKGRDFFYILLFVGLGVALSDQLSNVAKYGFERLRPCNDPTLIPRMRRVTCGGPFGFYSAHASNAFFLATFFTRVFKRFYGYWAYLLILWAAVVSYSRIYLGVHFPGDIFVGALMGFLLGGFMSTLALNTVYKR